MCARTILLFVFLFFRCTDDALHKDEALTCLAAMVKHIANLSRSHNSCTLSSSISLLLSAGAWFACIVSSKLQFHVARHSSPIFRPCRRRRRSNPFAHSERASLFAALNFHKLFSISNKFFTYYWWYVSAHFVFTMHMMYGEKVCLPIGSRACTIYDDLDPI